MNIIAGRFRHRKLLTNPGLTTRPITARVKESLFAQLEGYLEDARVADIYAGTGTIGLEALSRGARSVVFFEFDWEALGLLKQNVAALKVQDETVCWRTDVSKTSFKPQQAEGFLPYDVVFFDPPYVHTTRLRPGTMLFRSLERLARPDVTAPGVLLVLRCGSRTEFEMPPVWQREDIITYSSMDVHLFRKLGQVTAETEKSEESGEPADDEALSDQQTVAADQGSADR